MPKTKILKETRELIGYGCERGCEYSSGHYFKCPEHGTPPTTKKIHFTVVVPFEADECSMKISSR